MLLTIGMYLLGSSPCPCGMVGPTKKTLWGVFALAPVLVSLYNMLIGKKIVVLVALWFVFYIHKKCYPLVVHHLFFYLKRMFAFVLFQSLLLLINGEGISESVGWWAKKFPRKKIGHNDKFCRLKMELRN